VTLTSPDRDTRIPAANSHAFATTRDAVRAPVGPLTAMLQRPMLVIAIVAVCAGAGVALGLLRAPTYSAESRLGVGGTDIDSQALPGYVAATQSLAGSYARAIDSDAVLVSLSRATGEPAAVLAGRVSASPVAESSVIRVASTSTGPADAVRLANAAAGALVRYVQGLGTSSAESRKVLDDLRAASLRVERLDRARRYLRARSASTSSAAIQRRLQDNAADASAAEAEVKALGARYQNAQQTMPKNDFINLLSSARAAASDRRSALELRAFTGTVAGLLLAAALATALANRRPDSGPAA
jgi:capsular polysaccharide biosynthesis protein